MEFELVDTELEIKNIEMMASIIWPITYKGILSLEQIRYMLNKYLSKEAIENNIKDGYTYVIFKENEVRMGFLAYKFEQDHLFLSKLYVLPAFQNKGIASNAILYLSQYHQPIVLTVNKNNKNAIDKYLHLGFKQIDSVVTDIGNGYVMDDYIMKRK